MDTEQSLHTKSKVDILNDNNDGNATLEFVFGSGAVEIGDDFTVRLRLKMSSSMLVEVE